MWFLMFCILTLITSTTSLAQTASPTASDSAVTPTVVTSPTPTPDPTFALFEQYQSDQKYNQDLYQQAYLDYTQKKQVYTKYGTLTTQQDKIDATKKALIARNNAIRTYLIALRVDLDKYKDANPTDTQKYQIELSKWESWFNEQNSVVSAYNNDEDIRTWSTNFAKKYISIQQLMYTSLVVHQSNYKLTNLRQIQTLTDDIKNSPDLSTADQSWLGNLTIKTDQVNATLKSAFDLTQGKQNEIRFSNFYDNSKTQLNKANQYLIDMLSDLKSVVIKYSK